MSKKRLLCAVCISTRIPSSDKPSFYDDGDWWWLWWFYLHLHEFHYLTSPALMMIALASRWCQGKDENHGAWMIYCGMQRRSTILKNLMDSMEIMTILKEATGRDLMRTWYDVSALYPPIQEEMKIWKNMAWGPNDVISMWWDKMTFTMGWHFSRRPRLEESMWCDDNSLHWKRPDVCLMSMWCVVWCVASWQFSMRHWKRPDVCQTTRKAQPPFWFNAHSGIESCHIGLWIILWSWC